MKKKITIIGINYFPEDTAIGLYTSQLAEFLYKNDIEVTVVTGFPYYPSWRINKEYASKTTFFEDNIDYKKNNLKEIGKKVKKNFSYSSDNNSHFLKISEIKNFISKLDNNK